MRFTAIYHDDDAKTAESCAQLICGRALSQWWDVSDAAGPKTRVSETFSEPVPTLECITIVDQELKSFGCNIYSMRFVFEMFCEDNQIMGFCLKQTWF